MILHYPAVMVVIGDNCGGKLCYVDTLVSTSVLCQEKNKDYLS